MPDATLATVATESGTLSPSRERVPEPPALVFIGYGVACIAAGQWMLEVGIRRAGGWKGIRKLLSRAEALTVTLEAREMAEVGRGDE